MPCLAIASGLAASAAVSAEEMLIGPFQPRPAASFYVIADGKPVSAKLSARNGAGSDGDRILLRAFDPDERLSFWKYVEPGQSNLQTLGDMELNDLPDSVKNAPLKKGQLLLETELPVEGAGVNQLRIVAGACNSSFELRFSRPLEYGVSFQNGDFSPWKGQPKTLYAFVPPHAEELNIAGGPLIIRDEKGKVLLDDPKGGKIKVSATGVLWSFEYPDLEKCKFRAWGFPLILCPGKEAALAIKASVEVLPDGTTVCHKFQRKIAEALPKLLAKENVGSTEELLAISLSSREAEWLKNPLRNSMLLHPYSAYSAVGQALRNQNLDPKSHWAGAMGGFQDGSKESSKSWLALEKLPAPEGRWDRFIGPQGLASAGGVSPRTMDAQGLAEAAAVNEPFNPYYGRKELLYRAAIASLKDLMALGEDEVWPGESSSDPYPGFPGFVLGQKTLPTYALVAPLMPQDLRELWTEGVSRLVDRVYPDGLVSCRNQSSHFLTIFYDFAVGSGDPKRLALSKAYAARFIKGLHPAGFAVESQGPDLTYNGMTHWHMGYYAKESGDKDMLEAIRKSYAFFNHSVAPEPDGSSVIGASNFGHRTAGSFVSEQWGGARGTLDADLPEVAVWSKYMKESPGNIPAALAKPPKPAAPEIIFPKFLYFTDKPSEGCELPALSKTPFIKNLGDEMVAIRKPGYYALVYVGHPAPVEHYIKNKEKFRHPLPEGAEDNGGNVNSRQIAAFLGGGLSLFWTPSYGSAITGMNWSPLTHQGLVAVAEDGSRFWEDYFATKWKLDEAASRLSVSGRLEKLPLSYVRDYKFNDDSISVTLTLKAEKDCSLKSLSEVFPIPLGEKKKNGSAISCASKSFAVADSKGKGVDFVFSQDLALKAQPNGLVLNKLQVGRVEAALPSKLSAGQSFTLNYEIKPKGP